MKSLPFNSAIIPQVVQFGNSHDLPFHGYLNIRSGLPSSRKITLDQRLHSQIDSISRRMKHYGGLSASMILSNYLGPEQELRTRGIINHLIRQYPRLTILDIRRSLSRISHVEFLMDGLLPSDFPSKVFSCLGRKTTSWLMSDSSIPSHVESYSGLFPDHFVDVSLRNQKTPEIVVIRRLISYPFLCKKLYIRGNDSRRLLRILDGLKSEGYRLSPVALRLSREFRGSTSAKRKLL